MNTRRDAMNERPLSDWIDLYLYRLGNAMRARDYVHMALWGKKLRVLRELQRGQD